MKSILAHLFYPQYSNNHRPKILHLTSIFTVVFFLLFSSLFLSSFRTDYPQVLGAYSNISFQDLLVLTNQARQEEKVPPLVINSQLSDAAQKKASDMFANDYWAHNSPEGKTPWDFMKDAGYDYVYAGENLARGFSTPSDVVNAWIASPEHRANMMSRNFREVGFAVEEGNLNGEDTVLVVEELGGKEIIAPQGKIETLGNQTQREASSGTSPYQKFPKPQINSVAFSSNTIEIILAIFIGTFLLDLVVVERKKIARMVGHNVDHILFLSIILICVMVLSRGIII